MSFVRHFTLCHGVRHAQETPSLPTSLTKVHQGFPRNISERACIENSTSPATHRLPRASFEQSRVPKGHVEASRPQESPPGASVLARRRGGGEPWRAAQAPRVMLRSSHCWDRLPAHSRMVGTILSSSDGSSRHWLLLTCLRVSFCNREEREPSLFAHYFITDGVRAPSLLLRTDLCAVRVLL